MVCCDTSAEWKAWQVMCNVMWLSRNQAVATFSLRSASKCHSHLSWLMQATPLMVLRGISAQQRVLEAQSKSSVTHIGISSENKQNCIYSPWSQDDQANIWVNWIYWLGFRATVKATTRYKIFPNDRNLHLGKSNSKQLPIEYVCECAYFCCLLPVQNL